SEAVSESFIYTQHQNRTALFGNYKIQSKRNFLAAVISGRQEFVEGKPVPFSGSLALEAKFLKCFIIRGNAAQHYRLPTFNDLFYKGEGGLGVPDLKPETGWSEELSLINKYSFGIFSWELGATVFNRDINNWIIWQPVSSSIWSPKNLMKVWSRGVEYKLSIGIKKNKFNFQLSGLYNYVLSTNEKSALANDETIGKQLMYVPIQNAQGNATVSYKGTSLSYTQVYIGYRYTLSDNSDYLKPYTIGNISLAQTFSFSTSKIKIFVQLNNIWQEAYQVMEYRAMPLFNYQVGLSLLFNQPNKKQ
ncbi:MAG TPA: TonB-dependent receptor, partial [Bacteroidia bacterium]|nr:TonB-dependent receptor [Bacteroidia bacterium]